MSISLLDDIAASALDPSYAEVAQRRAETGTSPPQRHHVRAAAVVSVAVVGLLLALAVGHERAAAPSALRTRTALVDEVAAQERVVRGLVGDVERLRQETRELQATTLALSQEGTRLTETNDALERAAALTPLSGAGLVVVLTDADGDQQSSQSRESGRVQDRDVQDVVNALWAAGARGVAVNGIRLTGGTAIRTAGGAVLVDFRPVVSPYRVEAVGSSEDLETGFADSQVARRLQTWTQVYGLGFETHRAGSLALSAGAQTTPRHARALR